MTRVSMTYPQALRHQARINGVDYALSPQQHALLTALLLRRGEFVSTDELCAVLWPNPDFEGEFAETHLRVLLNQLRRLGLAVTCSNRFWMIEKPGQGLLGGRMKRAA